MSIHTSGLYIFPHFPYIFAHDNQAAIPQNPNSSKGHWWPLAAYNSITAAKWKENGSGEWVFPCVVERKTSLPTVSEHCMMASSNENIFRVTGPFVRGIHRPTVNSPHKGQWRGALVFSLICAWMNGWAKNLEAGILRRHRAHYDVILMGLVTYVTL